MKLIALAVAAIFALTATTAFADEMCSVLKAISSALAADNIAALEGPLIERMKKLPEFSASQDDCHYDGASTMPFVWCRHPMTTPGTAITDQIKQTVRQCFPGGRTDLNPFTFVDFASHKLAIKVDNEAIGYAHGYSVSVSWNSNGFPTGDWKFPLEGNWLVIAGAWPPSEAYKTKQRMALLSGSGITAKVVKTDDYPGLTPGLLAVVMGPTTRDKALEQLDTVKSVVPDAFIKEGQ